MNKINKERMWVFSPVYGVVMKVDIKGDMNEHQLKDAIINAVNHYEVLQQKIVIDPDGSAYFDTTEDRILVLEKMNKSWKEIITEQEKVPFAFHKGELIRFFYDITDNGATVLIIGHHLAGDGISFMYLIQDIMFSLEGIEVKDKSIHLYNMENLPRESKLRPPISWLLKSMNRKWKKTGKIFDFNDFSDMFESYWNNHDTMIGTYYFEQDDYNRLLTYSKENQITVNSIITTALIRSAEETCDVGMAASVREKDNTSMGNYATGISVKYQYNNKCDFITNAKKVQQLIYQKLNDPKKKYFLLQFMGNMEPTLIDAIYFEALSDYSNKTSKLFSNMFGYNGNPKGLSITNLTKAPIKTQYNSYEITDCIFVPPLILNAKRLIGVVSLRNKMILSLHIQKDMEAERNCKIFTQAMDYLKDII